MKNLRQKATSAFLWDYSGNLARQTATFVIGVFLARLLSPTEFGLIGMVMAFIGLSQGLLNLGLGAALVQRKDPSPLHYSSTFVMNVSLGLLLTAAAFFAAPVIARFYNEPRLIPITRALSVVLLLRSLTLVHQAWLRKHLRFNTITQIRLSAAVLSGLCGVGLAWHGFGVWSLVDQTLLGAVISLIGFWLLAGWKPTLRVSLPALKELWAFGIHMFSAGMLDALFTRADVFIVGKLFSATELGFFTRAKSLARFVIRFSSQSIGQVMFPVLSAIQDDQERFRRVTEQTLALVSFAAFALSGWLFVVARPFISLLLTDKWLPAAPILRLFCLSAYALPVNSIVLSVLKGKGHSRTFLQLEILKKVLYSVALVVGFQFGIRGFLIALAVTSFLSTGINMYASGKPVGLSLGRLARTVAPYGVAAIGAATALVFLPSSSLGDFAHLLVYTAVFGLCYLLLNAALRTGGLHIAVTVVMDAVGRPRSISQ